MLGLHLICFTLEQMTSAFTIAAFFAPGVSDESRLNCGSSLGLIGWVIMVWHKQRAELINQSQANDIDKHTGNNTTFKNDCIYKRPWTSFQGKLWISNFLSLVLTVINNVVILNVDSILFYFYGWPITWEMNHP